MKKSFLVSLFFVVMLVAPILVSAEPPPEMIGEKMAVKLTRGLANTATCVAEIPKQIALTGEEMGPVGYVVIGPIKGIGMTVYRGFMGLVETVFFGVPQPGYYDSAMEPSYVWDGWESKRDIPAAVQ